MEEELEFLKRGEIRTMQKDVVKLREEESEKERKKIITLKETRVEKEKSKEIKPEEVKEKIEVEKTTEETAAKGEPRPEEREEIEKEWLKENKEREREIEKEKKEILKTEEEELKEEQKKLDETLQALLIEREPFELKKRELEEEKKKIVEENLNPILGKEGKIEERKREIEKNEKTAETPQKEKEIELQRWKIDEEREAIEKEKWEVKEKIIKIEEGIKTNQEEINKSLVEEKKIEERIKEVSKKIEEIEEIPKLPSEALPSEIPPIPPEIETKKPEAEEIPPLPKKPPFFQKTLIRTIFLFGLILILGLFGWFQFKKPSTEEVLPPPEEGITPPEEIERPEIIILPSLITAIETKTPEISEKEEIPTILNQILAGELPKENFVRIAIKNISENRLVSLEDLSQAFQVNAPEEIFPKLEKDFTLLIYSQKEGKRVVLAGKIKEETNLKEILKSWEEKIKEEGIFVSGKKVSAQVPYFRTTFYQDVGIRFLTISKEDLGICYAWFNDYFIFATSLESIKKGIEDLKRPKIEEKVGQLFIVGFAEKTLTPELEEFFKKYKPGGILLLSKNIEDKEQLEKLISDLQVLSLKETGLPLFVAVDQEGGEISRVEFLSEKTPQSEILNPEEAYQIGLKRGQELKELGVNLNLAPLLDITQTGDFIFSRSFQKSSLKIGEYGKLLVAGQKAAEILTAIKHFPGYGGISFNPEGELATLEAVPEISQFKKVMEITPEMVMTSNIIYKEIDPSLPLTFSQKGIQFLKNNLGQDVLIISDDLDQNSLLNKFSLKEIVTKPIEAGVDLLIFSDYRVPAEQGLDEFLTALRNKEVSEIKIQEAISRIIQLKQKLIE